jgi:hypothetical protein
MVGGCGFEHRWFGNKRGRRVEQSREDERAREHRWRGMEERTPKRQWCPDGTDAVEKKKEKAESEREKTRGKALWRVVF